MKARLLGRRRNKAFRINGRCTSAVSFIRTLEIAGVDIREAEALALQGCDDLEYWRALVRACKRVGLELHINALQEDGTAKVIV